MIEPFNDEHFMKLAFQQAELALEQDEIPIGAIIVQNKKVIAKAFNQTEQLGDATAHAEMIAITAAMNFLGSKYLKDCTLYVTIEPCMMCGGAIDHAHIKRVVYGAKDEKKGFTVYQPPVLNKKIDIVSAIMEDECGNILTNFFKKKR